MIVLMILTVIFSSRQQMMSLNISRIATIGSLPIIQQWFSLVHKGVLGLEDNVYSVSLSLSLYIYIYIYRYIHIHSYTYIHVYIYI